VIGLDHLLACAPWRSDDAVTRYVSILRDRFGVAAMPLVLDDRIHYPEGALRTAVLMTAERTHSSETQVLVANQLLPETTAGRTLQ